MKGSGEGGFPKPGLPTALLGGGGVVSRVKKMSLFSVGAKKEELSV